MSTFKDIDNSRQIRMALILANFYSKSFPSWPEVMGVYGVNLPQNGHIVDWFMPVKGNIFQKIKTTKFINSRIFLIPLFKSNSYVISTFAIFIYQFRLFLTILRLNKTTNYNIFQVRDEIFSGVTVLLLKLILDKHYSFNYSFPYFEAVYEAYQNGEKVSKLKLFSFYFQDILLKKIIFKHCSFIFPISNEMLTALLNEGVARGKMYPLSLGVEPKIFKVNEHYLTLKKELHLGEDDFIYSYIGSLSVSRGIDIIIDAFEIVVKKYPNIKLLLIGSGTDLINLKNMVKQKQLTKSIIFTGQVSYFDVPNYVAISNVCLSIIKPLRSFYVSSPCKIFEYMLMGKTIIANLEIPEQKRVLTGAHCGELITYDKISLVNAMIKLVEISPDLQLLGENGRKWVLENRTFQIISDRLENIYFSILK